MPYKDPEKRRTYQEIYRRKWIANLSPEHRDRIRKADNERTKTRYAALSPKEKREKIIDKNRLRYATNPETRKRRHLEAKTRYHRMRLEVLNALGGVCSNPTCSWIDESGFRGCTDVRCLQIDHVRGQGTKETRSMSNYEFLKKVLGDTDGTYQLLCANCNWIKKVENKEHSTGRSRRPAPESPVDSSGPVPAVPTPC